MNKFQLLDDGLMVNKKKLMSSFYCHINYDDPTVRDCKKMINPKTRDAIIQSGYLLGQCRECKTVEARKEQEKKENY